MEWVGNVILRQVYPRERDPVRTVEEAVWAAGPVWMGAENLTRNGVPSLDCQQVSRRYAEHATSAHKTGSVWAYLPFPTYQH
jgi:hypothetical protein